MGTRVVVEQVCEYECDRCRSKFTMADGRWPEGWTQQRIGGAQGDEPSKLLCSVCMVQLRAFVASDAASVVAAASAASVPEAVRIERDRCVRIVDLARTLGDAIDPAYRGGASSWEALLGHRARLLEAIRANPPEIDRSARLRTSLVLSGSARLGMLPRVYEPPGRVNVPNLLDALRILAGAWRTDAVPLDPEAREASEQLARELLVLVDEAEGRHP